MTAEMPDLGLPVQRPINVNAAPVEVQHQASRVRPLKRLLSLGNIDAARRALVILDTRGDEHATRHNSRNRAPHQSAYGDGLEARRE